MLGACPISAHAQAYFLITELPLPLNLKKGQRDGEMEEQSV